MSEITINASQFITDLNNTMGTLLQKVSSIEAQLSSSQTSINSIREDVNSIKEKVDQINMYVNNQIANAHESFDKKLSALASKLEADIEKLENDIQPFLLNKKIRQKVFSWANSSLGAKILVILMPLLITGSLAVLGFELKNSPSVSQAHQLELQQKHLDALMKANENLQTLIKNKK